MQGMTITSHLHSSVRMILLVAERTTLGKVIEHAEDSWRPGQPVRTCARSSCVPLPRPRLNLPNIMHIYEHIRKLQKKINE